MARVKHGHGHGSRAPGTGNPTHIGFEGAEARHRARLWTYVAVCGGRRRPSNALLGGPHHIGLFRLHHRVGRS